MKIIQILKDNKKYIEKMRINGSFTAAPILIFSLTALFTSICFIFNIKNITFSLILAIGVVTVFGILRDRLMLISCIITVILSLISIRIAGLVYDISYDGMYFHKEAIYALANGWNPLRTSFWYYNYFGRLQDMALWLDNYPKGVWSFYACIYDIFGKIEYAKGANMIFVLMLFFSAYDTISTVFNKKGLVCFFVAMVFTANPVIASQYFTYMNDLPVAVFTMVCAFLGMKIYAGKAESIDYICLIAAFASSFAVKFTAPIFSGCVLMGFGIAFAIKNRGKNLIKPCVSVMIAVLIGVAVMGADPYIKHIKDGMHPVYPVMGEGSYDIMNTNAPKGIDEMSNPRALITSIFSKTSPNPEDAPVLKIPFSIHSDEKWAMTAPDARMGGFGVLFSGILIVSLVLGIYSLKKAKGISPLLPAVVVFTLLAMFFPESWWARYSPYTYYIPCMFLLAFSCANKTKIFVLGMCGLMLTNSAMNGFMVFRDFYRQSRIINWKIAEIQQTNKHVMFNINDFPCHEIWFNENNLDFELITNLNGKTNYYEFYKTTYFCFPDDMEFKFKQTK